ncbi:hypothetical protein LSM04_002293 [Trypanosoma melophagium]|uniref:uncharacterized protein n=1 Tax=Trypanosoma melophagium TaxID=715481 RepID=UPI00351A0DC7|nr:hypothetical protein LSM04_002293 [Trypanosoma melophagium]
MLRGYLVGALSEIKVLPIRILPSSREIFYPYTFFLYEPFTQSSKASEHLNKNGCCAGHPNHYHVYVSVYNQSLHEKLYKFVNQDMEHLSIVQNKQRENRLVKSSFPRRPTSSSLQVRKGVELPMNRTITYEKALLPEKIRISFNTLLHQKYRECYLSTDGVVDVTFSTGVKMLLSSLKSTEIIDRASIDSRARPCNYRRELCDMLIALDQLILLGREQPHKRRLSRLKCQTVNPF